MVAITEAIGSGPSGRRGIDSGATTEEDFILASGICTVRIDVALLSPGVTEGGVNVAVAPAGKPVTESATGELYAPLTDTVTMANETFPPGFTMPVCCAEPTTKSVSVVTETLTAAEVDGL